MSASSYDETEIAPRLIERRYSTGRIVHRSFVYFLGKQHLKTFEGMNRTEAKDAHREHENEIKSQGGGSLDEAAPRTLAELLDKAFAILDDEAEAGLGSKATIVNYRTAARKRILPHPIARKKLGQLDDNICTTWLVWLKKQPGTSYTHHGTVTALQSALKVARRKKWMKHDPLIAVDREKYFPQQKPAKPTVALSNEQALALVAAAESEAFKTQTDTDYSNIVLVNRYEGHRSSETCGLRWKDVDFKENTLSVSGQLARDQKMWEPVLTAEPKNGEDGVRAPVMFPQTRAALLRQREIEFAKGKGKPADLVFTKADGRPINAPNLRAAVRRAAALAGFTATTRQLRTSFLSAGAHAGISAVELETRSGNSAVTIERFYVKPIRTAAQQQQNIDRFLESGFGG